MSAHRQHTLPPQPFAPGAIERHVHPQRVELHRWLVRAMAIMLAAMLAGLFAGSAHAAEPAATQAAPERSALLPATVGLHLRSWHGHDPAGRWNNTNPGVYARWGNGATVGAYHNSQRRTSAYVGWTGDWPLTERISAGVTVGLISGYDRHVLPMAVPSVRVALGERTSLRTSLALNPRKSGASALHLSIEWALP
jgi:hypothetical protein